MFNAFPFFFAFLLLAPNRSGRRPLCMHMYQRHYNQGQTHTHTNTPAGSKTRLKTRGMDPPSAPRSRAALSFFPPAPTNPFPTPMLPTGVLLSLLFAKKKTMETNRQPLPPTFPNPRQPRPEQRDARRQPRAPKRSTTATHHPLRVYCAVKKPWSEMSYVSGHFPSSCGMCVCDSKGQRKGTGSI